MNDKIREGLTKLDVVIGYYFYVNTGKELNLPLFQDAKHFADATEYARLVIHYGLLDEIYNRIVKGTL